VGAVSRAAFEIARPRVARFSKRALGTAKRCHTGKDLDILFGFLLIYSFDIISRQTLACCSVAVSMPSSMERSHIIEHATATTTCECT
jgi:hypothetical protein